MPTGSTSSSRLQLTRALRERFLAEAVKALLEISETVQECLTTLLDEMTNARESQLRRDVWMAYKQSRPLWVDGTNKAWRECLNPPKQKKTSGLEAASLELVGTEVVENKILASRMVLAVNDKVLPQLEDLRIRIKFLEDIEDLEGHDLLRPEVLVLLLVEEWAKSGMSGESWPLVNEVVQRLLIERLMLAYKNANDLLISKGVMPSIELKDRVKSPTKSGASPPRPSPPDSETPVAQEPDSNAYKELGSTEEGSPQNPFPQEDGNGTGAWSSPQSHEGSQPGYASQQSVAPISRRMGSEQGLPPQASRESFFSGRLAWGGTPLEARTGEPSVASASQQLGGRPSASAPFWRQPPSANSSAAQVFEPSDASRWPSATTPMARARSHAQGLIGQIRKMFVSYGGGDFVGAERYVPSPALSAAMAYRPEGSGGYSAARSSYEDYSTSGIAKVANDLQEKSAELKKKAETKGEKATIEIVALMFQAILAEERIPPGIRVWFARLQMPVLRVALESPDFFGTTTHPARMLIDRMGSCVMGFDAVGVHGAAMETEIKRIVQVIEQYPETGKKVYEIVFGEFQKFLSKFLTEKGSVQKVVSVAQQMEQKETLTIQHTIEMRNMLKDMPIRIEIRDFLFKVWAEVLAVAAVRKGPQHADTLLLKKSTTDLIWTASAKPNRADRAKVIRNLPNLLLRLRSGMTLLAMAPSEQEAHIKRISDTLADAFMSKTQAIPQEKIEAMAQRLGHLEDFVSEDGMGDLPLDAESIEVMLDIDASAMEVIANGGSRPTAAMLAWAQELQLGSWYTLDYKQQITQVQLAWRSDRKHLNLFASPLGKSFLIQGGRLGAYLQEGLLLPQEEEALTVRATRDALAKLEANPERLLT